MTATLEQTQSDLLRLIGLAQQGEEVVIVKQGQPVAKLTGIPQSPPAPNRKAWLAKLARLRQQLASGKTGPTVEEILAEDRGD